MPLDHMYNINQAIQVHTGTHMNFDAAELMKFMRIHFSLF